jgi:hypothetical protein
VIEGLGREWARGPQYASEAARREWQPIIGAAQEAWKVAELVSVSEGMRVSARVAVLPEELAVAHRDTVGVGLEFTPYCFDGQNYRVAVHQPGYAKIWHNATANEDNELIGQLLGYPACCRTQFQRVWVEQRAADQAPHCNAFVGPWESNILLRHLGVRLVPHLPCSGECVETLSQARAFFDAGYKAGANMAAIERLLRLPVSYDAMNGVAIVDCGVFRFSHGTDYNPERVIRLRGGQEGEGGSGPPSWADNGFASRSSMERAHQTVLTVAKQKPAQRWLDLGAGDGTLLHAIGGQRLVGVEIDKAVCERGFKRHPEVTFYDAAIRSYLAGADETFDAALLMPGRLMELEPAQRDAAVAHLSRVARHVLVYAYGDWIEKYSGLAGLCEAAGLKCGVVNVGSAAQAAWLLPAEAHSVCGDSRGPDPLCGGC